MTKEWMQARRLIVAGAGAALVGVVLAGPAFGKETLEQRIQKLEDRAAIEQLILGDYPRALDGRDWKAYANTFASNGVLVQGTQETKGRAAIEAQFSTPRTPAAAPVAGAAPTAAAPAEPRPTTIASKHVISNLKIISLTPTHAETTAYWETISTRTSGTVVAGAGHYNDSLIKENGQWKFLRREIVNPTRAANAAAPAAAGAPRVQ